MPGRGPRRQERPARGSPPAANEGAPAPGEPVARLRILRRSLHPWIFQRMLHAPPGIAPGAAVAVVDRAGAFVGRGWCNPRSQIALRLLTEDPAQRLDGAFYRRRALQAAALRREVLRLDEVSDAWRVIHAEGDGLSGVVADRFGAHLVVEYYCLGAWRAAAEIEAGLREAFPGAQLHRLVDPASARREGPELERAARAAAAAPPPQQIEVREGAVRFLVSPGAGHKTGFFCDQRDNRLFFAGLARGRRVLDGCCYTGGFLLHALAGGAQAATGVDLDESALERAGENARLNGRAAEFVHADLFDFLRAQRAAGNPAGFDAVVLDPAKQARVREELARAEAAYTDLNRLALELLAPGGLLVTCSCSGLVSPAAFLSLLRQAAGQARRELQVLRVAGAGPDHPVALQCPETSYLKTVFCRVS